MATPITLVTGNDGKAQEYTDLLGIKVTAARAELTEVQSLDVTVVAKRKAADAFAQLRVPVLVDDTGLAVEAWNGLPGALITWFLATVGTPGILDMASGLANRRATALTALGYADAGGVRVFRGAVPGQLATEARGSRGFGYDAIFVPDGGTRTFAEMTSAEKNAVSHRRRAVRALKDGLGLL
jgi:XTP/dITP diphosphohydrolase